MQEVSRRRGRSSAILIVTGSLMLASSVAFAASVEPTIDGQNNLKCDDLGMELVTKFDPPADGTQDGVTITLDGDAIVASWSSDEPIHAVIVKGGQNGSNVYEYPEGSTGDTILTAPLNNNGKLPDLSHVTFCRGTEPPGPEPTETPTVEPTETPTVEPTETPTVEPTQTESEDPETQVLGVTLTQPDLAKTGLESWLIALMGAALMMIGLGIRTAPTREVATQ